MSRGDSDAITSALATATAVPITWGVPSVCSAPLIRSSIGSARSSADLVGEHQGLTVLGEGHEAYRPHALPPSRRWPVLPRVSHPGAFRNTVRASVTRWW
nr:hypothetical protein GCM10020092_103910 [Actinoplanes digitatis]